MTDFRVSGVLESIDKHLRELTDQVRLANKLALLNPELSTWEHVDPTQIIREVRRELFREGS